MTTCADDIMSQRVNANSERFVVVKTEANEANLLILQEKKWERKPPCVFYT